MAMKLISTGGKVSLKDLSLEIRDRVNHVCELDLFVEGKKTVLFLGSREDCVSAARDYLEMRFNITD